MCVLQFLLLIVQVCVHVLQPLLLDCASVCTCVATSPTHCASVCTCVATFPTYYTSDTTGQVCIYVAISFSCFSSEKTSLVVGTQSV